jgi:membrane protein
MKLRQLVDLTREALSQWWNDDTSTLGAALAYYAVFAFAPLAVLAVAVAGFMFGQEAAQGELHDRLESAVGPTFAAAIQQSFAYTQQHGSDTVATILSIVVLFIGAMGLFGQLQHSLNIIWGVQARTGRGWWGTIKDRLMSFVMVVFISVLLLASLI